MAFKKPQDGLDDVYAAAQHAHWGGSFHRAPGLEIIEESGAFIITCELPGADREDIRVDVSPHRVVIAALPRGALDVLRARSAGQADYTPFERAIPLATEVDPEAAEARLNNGVLEVVVPKRAAGGSSVHMIPPE